MPGEDFGTNSHGIEGRPNKEMLQIAMMYADYDFTKTLGIELSYGRYYDRDFATATAAVVIYEAAARTLGITEPNTEKLIRQALQTNQHQLFRIIGVMKDFHSESLHLDIRPMAIYIQQEND